MSQREQRARALKTLDELLSAYKHTIEVLNAELVLCKNHTETQDIATRIMATAATTEHLYQVRSYVASTGARGRKTIHTPRR